MPTQIKMLLVEDNPNDAELVLRELRKAGLEIDSQRVDTPSAYRAALDQKPDMILADYNLPQFSGVDAIRLLREQNLDIPLIIVSGTVGEEDAVACIKLGAADYLLKDRLGRLPEAINRALADKQRREAKKQADEALAFMAAIVKTSSDAIIGETLEGIILSWNAGAEAIYGYHEDEAIGHSITMIAPPDRSDEIPNLLQRLKQGETIENFETKRVRKDSQIIDVSLTVSPIFEADGTPKAASIIARDITARKEAERALERANRAYRTLSAGNQALLRSADENELLDAVCRAIVEVGGYNLAWIGYKVDDEDKTVRPMAWFGIGADQIPQAKLTWAETEQGRGPSGTAIRTGKLVAIQNIATEPESITYRNRALQLGHQAVAAFPLISQVEVLGGLCVYAPDPDSFSGEELALLEEMADDLAFGIETLRSRALREKAERELARVNRAYRTLSAANHALVHATDEQALLDAVTRQIVEVGGYLGGGVSYKVEDEAKTMLVMAYTGPGAEAIRKVALTWADTPQGQQPAAIAIRTGRAAIMRNLPTDPQSSVSVTRERLFEPSHIAMAALPLMAEDQVIGSLSVLATEPEGFSPEELDLLSELAGDLAFGIETIRTRLDRAFAVAALAEREAHFRLLFYANPHPMWVYDLETLRFLEVNDSAVALYGFSRDEFFEMTIPNIRPEEDVPGLLEHIRESPDGTRMTSEWRHRLKDGTLIDVEIASQPLEFEGRNARLVAAYNITERKQAAAAEHAAKEALEQQHERLSALYQVGKIVNSKLDVSEILDYVADEAMRVTHSTLGMVLVANPSTGLFERRSLRGFTPEEEKLAHATVLKLDQGLNGRVYQTQQLIQVEDVQAQPEYYRGFERTRSELVIPILREGIVLGNIDLQSAEVGGFREVDLNYLQALAEQAALAINNARLYEELENYNEFLKQAATAEHEAKVALEQQHERLVALYQVGKIVNSTLDVTKILNFVANEAMRVTNAARGLVLVANTSEGVFDRTSLRGFTPRERERAETAILTLDKGLNGQAYRTGEVVRVDDVRTQPEYFPLIKSTRSELVIPILREGIVLGNIDLQSTKVGGFLDIDLDYLQALAEQAALAINNARLYQELETYNEYLEQAVKERTTELESTKNRVESILSSVGDALMVLGMNGRIKQVNPSFERQTGFNPVEAENQDHHELLRLEFGSKGDYQSALETLTPGQVWQGQTNVTRKDGSTYDADFTIAPVRDDSGAIKMLVASIRDITFLKEVERAKDQFVSNVSHELRTPITSLKLNHSMIGRDPARQEVYVGRLGREINRLNDLIEDLLRLSRLEAGRVELSLVPVDLNAIASQLVADRTPIAEGRNLSLTFEEAPDLEPVSADPGLLVQALSVLLTNAMNYTPAEGKVVVSTTSREDKRGHWVGLRVSDTGPGISQSEQLRLFERFYRGTAGRASGAPGTGLGLSIAKQIVDRHRGRLEVASKGIPGEGAAFTIWLPAEK